MWVLFKSNYDKQLGRFYKGHKYDLPEGTLELISEDYYEKTCAPWDEHKDPRAVRLAELQDNVTRLKNLLSEIEGQREKFKAESEELVHEASQKQDAAGAAETRAAEAIEQSKADSATDDDKRYASQCVRIAERAGLESNKASAELMLAIAGSDLLRMDAEDIAADLNAAESELEGLTDEIASEQAKEKEQARQAAEAEAERAKEAKAEQAAEEARRKAAEKEGWDDCVKMLTAVNLVIGTGPEDQSDDGAAAAASNVPEGTGDQGTDLMSLNIPELRALAAERKIDLGNARLKADIIEKIVLAGASEPNNTELTEDEQTEQTTQDAGPKTQDAGLETQDDKPKS